MVSVVRLKLLAISLACPKNPRSRLACGRDGDATLEDGCPLASREWQELQADRSRSAGREVFLGGIQLGFVED